MVLKVIFIIFVLVFINCVEGEFNLTVVHISDFHSHWFEFDENKHDCSKQESKEGKCYGGFPRLLSFVRDIKKKEKNVLVLSSGEFFLGRSLHALHGWKLAHALLPKLELDAMSLSNHDFDSGVVELSGFLYAMKFPVLCANMWARNTSFLYSRVNKSAVIDVGGTKVGIVGYIHRHALKKTKNAISVKFLPEIPALQEEVQRLESEGVDKIIALGHAGYYTDLEIARNVKGVDIVIGGDSDIMLYDPGPDANETSKIGNIHGNYPRVHHQQPEEENNESLVNRTLVLHIPQHGMFVGVLRATFDDKGKIIHESGDPVLLDSSIPQDEDTLEFMEYAKGALETIAEHSRLPDESELLGKAMKHFDGNPRNCRMRECSLGNFIADAFLHEFTFHYRNKSEHRYMYEHWGPIDAVVFNSGPIKRSIEPGYIRINDILKSVHLGGFIRRIYMSGKQLKNMMEHSVKHYDPIGVTPPGAFLQMAGLRVEYDLSQPPGSRVRNLSIRCRDCGDDSHHPVKIYKTYIIGMPTFLRDGRDGFYDFEEINDEDTGQFDALLIVEHLRRMFEIEPVLDGRIKFYQPENVDLNLTSAVPPLLFGEQLPADNSLQNIPTDSENKNVSTAPGDATSDRRFEDESLNKQKGENYENEHASKLYETEHIRIPATDNELHTSLGNQHKTAIEFGLSKETHTGQNTPENVQFTKQKRAALTPTVTENLPSSVFLGNDGKSNESNVSVSLNKSVIKHNAKFEEFVKILLNSSQENFSSTLEKMVEFFPELPTDVQIPQLNDKLIRLRSDLASTEFNRIKINNTILEDYIPFMEKYLRDIFMDVIPAINSTTVKSTSREKSENSATDGDLKHFDKHFKNDKDDKITRFPSNIDFRTTVINIMKSILGEDILKKLSNELFDFSSMANASST